MRCFEREEKQIAIQISLNYFSIMGNRLTVSLLIIIIGKKLFLSVCDSNLKRSYKIVSLLNIVRLEMVLKN